MVDSQLQNLIEQAWEERKSLLPEGNDEVKDAVARVFNQIDSGKLRVAYKEGDEWLVNQWVKKAILLSFRLHPMKMIAGGPTYASEPCNWYDKVDSKFLGWTKADFEKAGFRAVPGCFVRHGSYVAPDVVLMPSFVNLGAYVDKGTMVDTWATVGSCAQIGKDCHISGGAGIGGVLEPLQANPVIIEDNCFIGARSEIAEGVIVEEGTVISMGVYIGASTKIVDRETGEIYQGRVPSYSVVVPGSIPGGTRSDGTQKPSLYAAVIVKRVDEQTRSKTSVNELLRSELS